MTDPPLAADAVEPGETDSEHRVGWLPVWLVLAVLLAETWLHFWLGGRTVRRQLREGTAGVRGSAPG